MFSFSQIKEDRGLCLQMNRTGLFHLFFGLVLFSFAFYFKAKLFLLDSTREGMYLKYLSLLLLSVPKITIICRSCLLLFLTSRFGITRKSALKILLSKLRHRARIYNKNYGLSSEKFKTPSSSSTSQPDTTPLTTLSHNNTQHKY